MEVPPCFRNLCGGFYPGSRDEYPTHEEWIAGTILGFTNAEEKKVIKEFLDELLSGAYSDDELERIWRRMTTSYNFSRGGHRMFLTEVRDCIVHAKKWRRGIYRSI